LLSFITPFTLPNPVLDPLLVPTFPVSCVIPVFPIAPLDEKSTKSAAVPNVGACARLNAGAKQHVSIVNVLRSIFFMFFYFRCELIFTVQRWDLKK
jgi:hypothetical protein